MYTTSSQFHNWTFASEADILTERAKANRKHIEKFGKNVKNEDSYFLSVDEEQILLQHYEEVLYGFCCTFKPKIPPYVMNTAFHYFKRFYLTTSVMDHHPKEILVTCVYLAAKTEEFYLPLKQIITNVEGDQEKAGKIIVDKELIIMEQMNFNLIIHHPFRPIEGFMIDMKTRNCFTSPEQLRPGAKEYLKKLLLTNACLLYSPTQHALAALSHAAILINESIEPYLDVLLKDSTDKERKCLLDIIQAILKINSVKPLPPKEVIEVLKLRLENCRNQAHNFGTEEYLSYNEAKSFSLEEEEQNIAKLLETV